jgi:two-component system response regulator YesN
LKGFTIDKYKRLCEVVKQYFDFTVTVGIGRPARGFKAVRSSYKDALAALQNKFIISGSKVLEYSKLESEGMNIGFYPSEINENLLLGLKMNDLDGIKAELVNVFAFIKEHRLSADYTITIFVGLISLCLSYITELGKNIEDIFGKNFSPYSEIRNLESMEATYHWFTELFEKIIHYSSQNKLTKSRILVKKVKDYIDSNLQDKDLALEKISRSVFINSSYLRKTFKREVGMTVSDYITSARMQKAKELLASGRDIAISRVSEVVGYSDVSYFSKCFKKYTGVSPSEYANMKK